MESQLASFETYVNTLADLGVFPTFTRFFNGWTCVLRNASTKQLIPIRESEQCWAQTMLGSLTVAVNLMNATFPNPKELHSYISTGLHPISDSAKETNPLLDIDFANLR